MQSCDDLYASPSAEHLRCVQRVPAKLACRCIHLVALEACTALQNVCGKLLHLDAGVCLECYDVAFRKGSDREVSRLGVTIAKPVQIPVWGRTATRARHCCEIHLAKHLLDDTMFLFAGGSVFSLVSDVSSSQARVFWTRP